MQHKITASDSSTVKLYLVFSYLQSVSIYFIGQLVSPDLSLCATQSACYILYVRKMKDGLSHQKCPSQDRTSNTMRTRFGIKCKSLMWASSLV